MAISKQLRDEADRTIAGISDYYEKYGDTLIDAEEREHRISKVTAALEGCNGLTEKEKIQKTAENLFGLTCTWERDSLALKRELRLNREEFSKAFDKSKKETAEEFTKLGATVTALDSKMDTLATELSSLGRELKRMSQCHIALPATTPGDNNYVRTNGQPVISQMSSWHAKIINLLDAHFGTAVSFVLIILLFLILSGNLEWISTFISNCKS